MGESFLETLRLDGNPLCCPPLEICAQGIEAMRQYFAELDNDTQVLNEVKILLVGEGAAGKTSLVNRLFGEAFDEHQDSTDGISIRGWEPKADGRKIKANIWDFGGQETQRATHQFFLSKRSLYILVLDNRKNEKPDLWRRITSLDCAEQDG
jgi:GTPase SAR1 family protein